MGPDRESSRRNTAARNAADDPPKDVSKKRRRTDRYPRPGAPTEREAAALAALDKFSRGVFLLDNDGVISFTNRAAEAMLARDNGLLIHANQLRFKSSVTNDAFAQFISQGSDASADKRVLCVAAIPPGCLYRMLVSRLDHGAGYCVFVYEPNGGQQPLPVSVLRDLYGLTVAEANLAIELFVGRSLAQAASARGISINTAKHTLKSVFQKCSVSSQAELLLLLSLGPRTL